MVDCLIIGGGAVGLSIAYELLCRGLSVQVIDRGEFGREASWAGAGILPPANRATAVDPLDQLRAWSHDLHPEWAERLRAETGIDTGYRRCGGLYVARSSGEAAALTAFAQWLRSLDIAIERLTPAALLEIEPGLRELVESGRLRAVYAVPDEAQLRNPDHLRALQAACRQRGGQLSAHVEVESLLVAGSRLSAVQTNRGLLQAERYCIAAGAWTERLLRPLGCLTGILPIRGQMVMFRCSHPPLRRIVNEGPRYVVPRDDGRVLVGSTEEEVGFDKRTSAEAIKELIELARSLVPDLRNAEIEKSWAGLRPGSLDGFPYLGPLPGLENAFIAAGHFRSGLHLSTGTAVVMAQLILGEEPAIDVAPFRVARG